MVTTRRQTRSNGGEDSSIIEASSPAPIAPAVSRRQRKLPVRGKAAAAAASDDDASSSNLESSIVIELRAKTDSDEEGVAEVADEEEADTTITGAEQPAPEPEIEEPSSQVKPARTFIGKKITFGDDDDVVEVVGELEDATAEKLTIAPTISEPSDDGSDSDDAPEAVSTSKTAAQAIKSAKAANKAIAEQAKAQKRKRQERSVRLQEQATSRKAAAAAVASAATPQKPTSPSEDASMPDADEDDDDMTPRTQLHLESAAAFSAARKRSAAPTPSSKPSSLPALLPDEFLNSDSEGEDDEAAANAADDAAGRPRKARKLATADRAITKDARRAAAPAPDRQVGSTIYRAAARKRDERLAPRSSKHSANLKRDLLVRGRTAVKANKGFFV
ncbi:hypothetical protein F5X68DRAFT_275850 [Plectosphaerella plurivora]|uniref:Uncharacterized protein n=1 Tax=Plectosphaerella plurivora TaxID=936078 RepID=A0A9P9ACP7_9PEZI|nr:hypothetical protein F5X68DRAFT_275850 [Plectosphaerella plurivora]